MLLSKISEIYANQIIAAYYLQISKQEHVISLENPSNQEKEFFR